jgi:hypothetical protein
MLLVHGIESLYQTERVQDEFFHLFEALKRRGSRLFFASDRPPGRIEGIDERLRSRFEGGLVLQLTATTLPKGASEIVVEEGTPVAPAGWEDVPVTEVGVEAMVAAPPDDASLAAYVAGGEPATVKWLPSPESVVWTWPRLDERIVDELE